jgi:hypothetical protein
MNATITKTAIVAATALLVGASTASAVVVTNGSFEADAGIALDGQAFSTLVGGAPGSSNSWSVFTSLPGWTTISGSGIEVQTNNTLTTINAQDGSHYVELDSNNDSAMQQTITFTSTGRYVLSFYFSPRDGNPSSNGIAYSISGGLLSGSITGPGSGPPVTAVGTWTPILAEFIVTTAGSYNLVFAASPTDAGSVGGLIDNVSIAAVPVPAGGLLLLGALGGLAALRRRKTI